MAFKHILKRTSRADEKITLMKLGHLHNKDELGFPQEEYIPIQELHGIIQRPDHIEINTKGQEGNPKYNAYLMPDFNIKVDELNNYRIKFERPFETMLLKITEYNPNLFLRHKRHHIKLKLKLEKKYVRPGEH